MGFWDREVRDSFDDMFDYNRDGHLDPFEQYMQYEFIEKSMKSDSADKTGEDERDFLYSDLDFEELQDMSDDERREALEDAGYDSDEFDDF